jgi:hypothetical protein
MTKLPCYAPIIRPFTRRSLFWWAVLLCIASVTIRLLWPIVPLIVTKYMVLGTIHIVHAAYGGSCSARDVTVIAVERCEGRLSCDMMFTPSTPGESERHCAADVVVSWTCDGSPDMKLAVVANPAPKANVSISCQIDARGGNK